MKKLLALLLVLAISAFCMFSCKKDNDDKNNNNDNDSSQNGGNEDGEIEEEGEGLLNKDNIDPDGWTKVD